MHDALPEAGALEQLFASPPTTFYPVPWWAWTGDMRDGEMQRQLRLMREQHIYEYFLFPIYGLEVEYCSAAWWAKVRRALEMTRDLDMRMWIYDEYNWPSGVCAGKVLADHPETRCRELRWHAAEVAPGGAVELRFRGELLSLLRLDGEAMESLALPPGRAVAEETHPGLPLPTQVAWTNESETPARVLLAYTDLWLGRLPCVDGSLWTTGEPGYIDTMTREATQRFIEYTHDEYARHVGDFLGSTIVGCFTDEPGISRQFIPWSPALEAEYTARYGEPLREHVAELLLPTGNYRQTRQRFYTLAGELFERHYIRPQVEWCERHGITYTGHLLWEESLRGNVLFSGDFYVAARSMHIPGLDMLESRTNYWRPDFGPSLYGGDEDVRPFAQTAKLLQSVARHAGRERIMCEAYGIFPWSQCMPEQKRATDWLCALGVNLINDNSLIFSIADFRKQRIAGKHFTSPWWPHYHRFSDYAARACLMSTVGRLASDVALLYPGSTTQALTDIGGWDAAVGHSDHPRLVSLQSSFWAATDSLLRLHRDFEYVFEAVLLAAACGEGELRCEHAAYRALVVPCCPTLPSDVVAKLGAFARSGGLVVFLDEMPSVPFLEGDDSVAAASELLALPNVHLVPSDDPPALERDLALLLEVHAPPFVRVAGEASRSILTAHRLAEGKHVVSIANQSYEWASVEVELASGTAFDLWDAETGTAASLRLQQAADRTTVSLELAPLEALYLVERGDGPAPSAPWRRPPADARVVLLADEWRFATDRPNLLLLPTSVRLDPEDRGERESWAQDRGEEAWLRVEADHIPATLDPEGTPFYWVRARFEVAEPVADVELVCDTSLFGSAYLDGHRLPDGSPTELWDAANVSFPVGRLEPGEHRVHVRACTSPYNAAQVRGADLVDPRRVEPMVLRGAFAVRDGVLTAPAERLRTGSWTEQGLPHFAGGGVYEQTVELPPAQEVWLDLGGVLDLAEVWVNGCLATVRPWAPYWAEITPHVVPGRNEVRVVVVNSLGNLLKTYYMGYVTRTWPAGLMGPCRLLVR